MGLRLNVVPDAIRSFVPERRFYLESGVHPFLVVRPVNQSQGHLVIVADLFTDPRVRSIARGLLGSRLFTFPGIDIL